MDTQGQAGTFLADVLERYPAADVAYTRYNARRALRREIGRQESRELGGAVALFNGVCDDAYYNRIVGLTETDLADLEATIGWYHDHGRACHVSLTSEQATEGLLEALAERGFGLRRCDSVLGQAVGQVAPPSGSWRVEQAERGLLAAVCELWREDGDEPIPPDVLAARADANLEEHFVILVAYLQNRPVAMGTVFLHDGLAWLGNANTLRKVRGRGAHRAILAHRLWLARQRGCRAAITDTAFGTVSHRNALRGGMHPLFVSLELTLPVPG